MGVKYTMYREKKLFSSMKYGGSLQMWWHGDFLEQMELRNIICLINFYGNGDVLTKGLQCFVCGKEVVLWKRIHDSQGFVDAFGVYREWKVMIGQLITIYVNSTVFSAWSGLNQIQHHLAMDRCMIPNRGRH